MDVENCRVVTVSGNKCPKGLGYAVSEIEDPTRTLTSAVLTDGLEIRMVPVRTNKPLPKADLIRAMDEIKKIKLKKPVRAGEMLVRDFVRAGVNLIATRSCSKL